MTPKDLISLKSWFSGYCKSFYSSNEEDQQNISLKEVHSYNVCSNIVRIAGEESLSSNEILLAETVGLLHDVGRFRQYAKYRTFKDSISVNHGLLGSEILLGEKVLKDLPENEQKLIMQAVKFHNSFSIPDIENAETIRFLKLIRDADKLDIWRVFFDYYEKAPEDRPSAVGLGFPDVPEYSKEVLSLVFKKQLIPLSMLKTLNDFKLTKLSWIYDLNFSTSLRMVVENDYIYRISETLPQTDEIRKVVEFLQAHVRERMQERTDG